LTDGMGRAVDFKRCILIMTSNTGFNQTGGVRFAGDSEIVDTQPVKNLFTPEFLDRLDEVIRFKPLGETELVNIARTLLEDMRVELASRDLRITIDTKVANYLVSKVKLKGSSRQLRAILRDEIEDPLSLALLSFPEGEIHIEVRSGKLEFGRPELVGDF
jgi:ATP-dependent Clp protease ATP-binding subunit ClpC